MKNILLKKINKAFISLLFINNLFGATGDLDTTFNPSGAGPTQPGTVFTTIGDYSSAYSIALQNDGKIFAGGYSQELGSDSFTLVRYNIDGSLDSSFGQGGISATQIPGSSTSYINSIALQSDGKIVAGGYVTIGGFDFGAVARYNSDGSIDSSFGTNGIVIEQVPGATYSYISSIAIQADGKIVVGGQATLGVTINFTLARYNTDGTPDVSFGQDGITITLVGSSESAINSIAFQSSGKIVVGGYANISGTNNLTIARYNTDGSIDTSFGQDGILTTPVAGASYATINSIALQSDDKIVAGGYSTIAGVDTFTLARYSSSGSLDTSLGSTGIVTTAIPGYTESIIYSVAIQSDNKIIAGGLASGFALKDFALARYNVNGSLDSSFGSNGIVSTTIAYIPGATAYSILIQPDGKIVAGGDSYINASSNFALARYLASSTLIISPLALALIDKYCAA